MADELERTPHPQISLGSQGALARELRGSFVGARKFSAVVRIKDGELGDEDASCKGYFGSVSC
jgi:hypothetical protein